MFDEHAFGRSGAFTVGAEEELILVEPPGYGIAHRSTEVLGAMDVPVGSAHHDFYAALIEFTSPIAKDAMEAVGALATLRAAMRAAGGDAIGAGLHPGASLGDVLVTDADRYRRVERMHVGAVHRTPEAAFHVHVGIPDPETAVRAFNSLRERLPLLLALAANSPFWYGVDSGFASARTVHNKAYPRFDIPRAFRDYDDYASTMRGLMAAGDLWDYTLAWWDVRLHPRLGTVEVRIMDGQSSLQALAGITALVHGLAKHGATSGGSDLPREVLAENCFRAARYGLDATIWADGALRPLRALVADATATARSHTRGLGSEAALDEIERIVRDGNGATRQRDAFARGGMPAVLSSLAAETAAPLA